MIKQRRYRTMLDFFTAGTIRGRGNRGDQPYPTLKKSFVIKTLFDEKSLKIW